MLLLPVMDSVATFFSTCSISGTTSFLARMAWKRQTHELVTVQTHKNVQRNYEF